MLCAHCDTVCWTPVTEIGITMDESKKYAGITNMAQAPLGADDRAGIFIILKLIANGYRPYVLLTTDEEVGGFGANAASMEIFSPEVKFILELDRQGAIDAAMYDCNNEKFMNMLTEYGFTPVSGTFSDICIFAPGWDIAAANLSVGYYHEHTPMETLFVKEMEWTIQRVQKILDDYEKFEYYKFEPKYKDYLWYSTAYGINFSEIELKPKKKKKGKKNDGYIKEQFYNMQEANYGSERNISKAAG